MPIPDSALLTLMLHGGDSNEITTILSSSVNSSMTIYFYVKVKLYWNGLVDKTRIARFQIDVISCDLDSSDHAWSTREELVIQIGQ